MIQPTFFLFECLPDGSVLEVGFLCGSLVVEDNTNYREWWF